MNDVSRKIRKSIDHDDAKYQVKLLASGFQKLSYSQTYCK